jgi:heme-degrading monooxygenase HmoA
LISVENHIPVKKKFREAFEARFQTDNRHVHNSPGFVRNEVLRPVEGDDQYIVRTYWDSIESFENWTKSEEFRKAHSNTPSGETFRGKSHLTIHEVISKTEV